jgi:hypothetical protein
MSADVEMNDSVLITKRWNGYGFLVLHLKGGQSKSEAVQEGTWKAFDNPADAYEAGELLATGRGVRLEREVVEEIRQAFRTVKIMRVLVDKGPDA